MVNAKDFCTCKDKECPMNPCNHDMGCTPCIKTNLAQGEIPSCFVNLAGLERRHEGYFIKDFAEAVMNKLAE